MKKIKSIGGFSIYEKSEKELASDKKDDIISCKYNVFLPEESPQEMCCADWECDNLQEAIDFIKSY